MSRWRLLFLFVAVLWSVETTPARAEVIQVLIDKLAFSPVEVKAKIGDTINWTNNDILTHTATIPGKWDVLLPVGKSAGIVATEAGIFDYYCRFHPNMKGRVIVAP
jgi:plastocyanin